MKILHVSHTAELGGAERCLLTLLGRLDRGSFDSVVVVPDDGPLLERLRALPVRVVRSPMEWWIRPPFAIPFTASHVEERVARLAAIAREERAELVHTNTSVVWEGALAARAAGIPHLWHLHEIVTDHPGLAPVLPLPIAGWLMGKLSHRIVTVSRAVERKLPATVNRDLVLTVPNGIDAGPPPGGPRPDLRSVPDLAPDARVVLTVAAVVEEKGHDLLLDAAARVRERDPRVVFLLAGGGHPAALQALRERIRAARLAGTVHCLGFRSDVPDLLRSADVLALPSRTEAFPTVILEAMAAGLPVVATDCGGPAEMVMEGETGHLTPVGDAGALADRILAVLADPAAARAMGGRGRRRCEERFEAGRFARDMGRAFLETAARPSPAADGAETLLIDSFTALYQELCELRRDTASLRRETAGLRSSLSWRVTGPLRWARRVAAGERDPAGQG